MTTGFFKEKSCYICGTKHTYPEIGSVVEYAGPKDLDNRPSNTQRSSVYMLVQRCLTCGYCATDISDGDPTAGEIVESEAYKSQLSYPDYPDTANSFLCQAIIQERKGALAEAGWTMLCAAWVCDDGNLRVPAAECRKRAFAFFNAVWKKGETFGANRGQEAVIMVDLLRRAGLFEDAGELCTAELAESHTEDARAVLAYQAGLIEASDAKRHTIEEGLRERE